MYRFTPRAAHFGRRTIVVLQVRSPVLPTGATDQESLLSELLLSLCSCDSWGHNTLKSGAVSLLVWVKGGMRHFEGGAAALALTRVCDF